MAKLVYISADYSENDGDRAVVDELKKWGSDDLHKVDFVDMADPSESVSDSSDCRPCDLKREFNKQIEKSSMVIFVVGDKTISREAGNGCLRNKQVDCECTPYKQNAGGTLKCKITGPVGPVAGYIGPINEYSYLRHEFEQAKKCGKRIVIVYNSLKNMKTWLPKYMEGYESIAKPFWVLNARGEKVGDYEYIKQILG